MPELETRFAELPDWLKSNNPPAPSWLQRQENTRRNQEEQRRNLALELDRRRTEQDLKKAAFELTVEDQNREMELRGDEALAKIAPAMGNYFQEGDVIGAGNYLLSEASRNPTITRSKQFNQYLNMLGTSFGAKVMQDRMNQMAAQVEAANQSRILSDRENQARMAELRARVAEQGGKSDEVNRRFLFGKQLSRIQKQIDVIDKDLTLSNEEKARRKDPLFRQQTALEFAFDKGQDLVDALDAMEAPAPAPVVDEVEQVFDSWDKQIDLFEATQTGKLDLKPDGTVKAVSLDWFSGMTPAEARKEVAKKRAAYRSGKPATSDARTTPQDPRMGGLPRPPVVLKAEDIK